jgi:hypothetical protein
VDQSVGGTCDKKLQLIDTVVLQYNINKYLTLTCISTGIQHEREIQYIIAAVTVIQVRANVRLSHLVGRVLDTGIDIQPNVGNSVVITLHQSAYSNYLYTVLCIRYTIGNTRIT